MLLLHASVLQSTYRWFGENDAWVISPPDFPLPPPAGICVEITDLLGLRALGQSQDFIARPMKGL